MKKYIVLGILGFTMSFNFIHATGIAYTKWGSWVAFTMSVLITFLFLCIWEDKNE